MSIASPSAITFGRLQDLAPREAWAHEAHAFTPWLAENIDHLSEAIGIPLELTGQEVRVETFAADILARNPQDGSVVLIENQLEATDHTHLGQIMTYLAGLEAKTVVWIAPTFREPHLSAVRWLNEHTADGFSFFAVKLRVVRIGDSPFAPIFEVVAKPNEWEQSVRQLSVERNSHAPIRSEYWAEFKSRYAQHPLVPHNRHLALKRPEDQDFDIVIGINRKHARIWYEFATQAELEDFRAQHEGAPEGIQTLLGPVGNRTSQPIAFYASTKSDLYDKETWPETMAWHNEMLAKYRQAARLLVNEETDV